MENQTLNPEGTFNVLMDNCIFCKIADGTMPSTKLWEDKDFLAILDIMPNTRGMTLVLTKSGR